MKFRQKLVLLHRYVGLVMAGFLIITSLTGAVLVWYNEIDLWINQQLTQHNQTNNPLLDAPSPFELRKQVERAFPYGYVNWMQLDSPASTNITVFYIEPKPFADGVVPHLPFDEVFVDRFTGEIVGKRRWGDISQGWTNLMPFLYRLHQSLTLGQIGTYLLGFIAFLWFIDCFTGLLLTFPTKRSKSQSWAQRWKKTWQVRWKAGTYKLTFDFHTALSLWAWIFLSIFALSSMAMTLQAEIYRPVMSTFMNFSKQTIPNTPKVIEAKTSPEIGWEQGYFLASFYVDQLSYMFDFTLLKHERLAFYPEKNLLKLMSRTSLDVNDTFGQTWVFIDASSGQLKGYSLPTGVATGDTFTRWLTTLHIARIGGDPLSHFNHADRNIDHGRNHHRCSHLVAKTTILS